MRKRIDRWRSLARGERWLLVRLALQLALIGAALRTVGLRRTYWALQRLGASERGGGDDGEFSGAAAERLADLVRIAARHGPSRAGCLPQSVALWWLLRRRGVPAMLMMGVRKPGDSVRAHAWVELFGRALGDPAALAGRYAGYPGLDRHLAVPTAGRSPVNDAPVTANPTP